MSRPIPLLLLLFCATSPLQAAPLRSQPPKPQFHHHLPASGFQGPAQNTLPEPTLSPTLFDRLARDVETHRMTEADAAYYALLAVRAPDRLPAALQALPHPPLRCLTGLFRDARASLPLYAPARRQEVEALLALPDPDSFAGFIDSERYPLRVHYQLEADYEKSLEGLGYLERAYEVEVLETGFKPPLSDGDYGGSSSYDMFFMHGLGGCSTVSAGSEVASEYRGQYPAATYYDIDAYGTPELFDVTVAHEFNHGIQAGYDWFETLISLEMTATFMEDVVFDDRNDYYNYLFMFQSLPQKPIDYRGYSFSYYSYASNLFLHFIREAYAGGDAAFAVRLWEENQDRGKITNEPDYLDAMEIVVQELAGVSLTDATRTFAEWRWFVGSYDDGAHLEEGAAMGDKNRPFVAADYSAFALPVVVSPSQFEKPCELGANYIHLEQLDQVQDRSLELTFNGEPSVEWGVDLLAYPVEGGPAEVTHLTVVNDGVSGSLPLEGLRTVVVVVSNLSDGTHDPDTHDYAGTPYTLELHLSQ